MSEQKGRPLEAKEVLEINKGLSAAGLGPMEFGYDAQGNQVIEGEHVRESAADEDPEWLTRSKEVIAKSARSMEEAMEKEEERLRDEFAKAALQGPLADSEYGLGSVGMANRCYDIADAMMQERSRRRDRSSD